MWRQHRTFSVGLVQSIVIVALVLVPTPPAISQTMAWLNQPDPPHSVDPAKADFPFHLQFDFQYMYGEADGSLQTPAGGEPGTTSHNRPDLGEIGIDHAHVFDASLSLQFQAHIFTFGAQIIHMDGSD